MSTSIYTFVVDRSTGMGRLGWFEHLGTAVPTQTEWESALLTGNAGVTGVDLTVVTKTDAAKRFRLVMADESVAEVASAISEYNNSGLAVISANMWAEAGDDDE